MKRAYIGSRVTFDANISRLMNVGLITVRQIPGEHEGNEYTVFLPEEIDLSAPSHTSTPTMGSRTNQAGQTTWSNSGYYVDRPDMPESTSTSQGVNSYESEVYGGSKTRSKTGLLNDDELFQGLNAQLALLIGQITGSDPVLSATEKQNWEEVGRVLAGEIINAAVKTESITSVPAFMAEHLRRRFARAAAVHRVSSDNVNTREEYEAERNAAPASHVMDEAQLNESAEMLAEFISRGDYTPEKLAEQFAAGFTPENWKTVLEKALSLSAK